MSLSIFVTPEADDQIRIIDAWWRANRPAAPNLFAEEIADAFATLEQIPEIGKPYSKLKTVVGLPRILLRASRYHVYYVARVDAVTVLAVWHSQRGQRPPL